MTEQRKESSDKFIIEDTEGNPMLILPYPISRKALADPLYRIMRELGSIRTWAEYRLQGINNSIHMVYTGYSVILAIEVYLPSYIGSPSSADDVLKELSKVKGAVRQEFRRGTSLGIVKDTEQKDINNNEENNNGDNNES